MQLNNLGSGSGGNATLLRAHEQAPMLMVDCGFGIRELEKRLHEADLKPEQIRAILITHEHGDHAGCVASWSRKYDCPVYLSRGTWHALGEPQFGGGLHRIRDGQAFELHGIHCHPFTVPHDAREPLQFRFEADDRRLGLLTDLGHVTPHVIAQLQGLHMLVLECNHDPKMLSNGRYPPSLKRRVGGDWGHLSNPQAAAILQQVWHPELKRVIAAHLSEANNQVTLALDALAAVLSTLDATPEATRIDTASAAVATDWLDV